MKKAGNEHSDDEINFYSDAISSPGDCCASPSFHR